MKNGKRYALIAAAVLAAGLLCFFVFRPGKTSAPGENLLVNGDFSQVGENGPLGWYKEAYGGLAGSDFEVLESGAGNMAHIVNHMLKDARFAQTVEVEPNTLYHLHGYIRSSAASGWGANLSVEDVYVYTESLFDTDGQWREVSLYGRTGKNQRSINVFVRLGGYSGEAVGEAYFKDISLTKVEGVPEGIYAQSWYSEPYHSPADTANAKAANAGMKLVAVSLAYVLVFALLCHFFRKPETLKPEKPAADAWAAALLLLVCCAGRLLIAAYSKGYDVDIGCFRSWANRMAETGPAGFYNPVNPFSSCDYPPGYMLVLWPVGVIGRLLGTGATEFMVKVPPVLGDMALCAVLYLEARRHKLNLPASLALTCLYALNPLAVTTGAAWGQADSIMTLLLVLTVIYALREKWIAALPFYMASVLVKPQALMFGPLGLLALVMHILHSWKDQEKKKAMLRDVGLGLAILVGVAVAVVLPFSLRMSPDWLITLYGQTMGRYAYATVNGCNLYFLMGKNWVAAESSLHGEFWMPFLVYCLAVLPLLAQGLIHSPILKRRQGEKKDWLRLYTLGGMALALGIALIVLGLMNKLTYSSLGTVMVVYSVGIMGALYLLSDDPDELPVFGAAMLLLLYNTGSMMHERYLFPAVALLLLGYLRKRDTRILWLAVGVTVSGLMNVGCALDRNARIGGASGHLDAPAVGINSDMAVLEYFSAALNTALCFGSLMLCSALSRGETVPFAETMRAPSPLPKETPTRKMTLRDWTVLSCVTVAYAALAFTNLGSTKAPQTAYVAGSPSEHIVFDLGESRHFKMLYYGGIHYYDSNFTVEIGEDDENWTQTYTAGMAQGDCFKWKYVSYSTNGTYPADLAGRYVRITSDHYSLTLFEVLFKDFESGEVLPAKIVLRDADNASAQYLLDEQDSMEGDDPSWFNSTYFDEIYHARTGYEHYKHMQPYETTHPPLGKVFISWCIAIFGMTPFGWRFAGALAGVLMLPGMYLLGRLLIKRSWGGLAACGLMALDLMHFTQTRIATIDSFVVLFIIWMVYFMLRWYFMDFYHTPFWKTLVPLALSGLCMGLGVASKWTGCYAGVILAVIFFAGIWRRARLALAAKKIPEKKRTQEEKAMAQGSGKLLITVASCLVFFVAVPALIYYCSYIPYFAYDGVGVTPKKVIEAAVGTYFTDGRVGGMLGYHSEPGRGMDHDFYSPWYQWPVIGKPMWYASNAFEPTGYESSIMALGNPAVWWGGLIAMAACLLVWISRHVRRDRTLTPFTKDDDTRPALLLLCYFGQLLPWILVPRGTYIYHYFPCVPFLILAMCLMLEMLGDRLAAAPQNVDMTLEDGNRKKRAKWIEIGILAALLLAAAVLFVLFFPYASGVTAPRSWMDAMKWFDRWLWY